MLTETSEALHSLQQNPNVDQLNQLLDRICTQESHDSSSDYFIGWFNTVFDSNLSIVSKRSLLSSLLERTKSLPTVSQILVGRHAVQALRSSVVSYQEQDTDFRGLLADALTSEEQYVEAAKTLQDLQLESSQKKVSDEEKFDIWIRICRLYLEVDDTVTAEAYLNRAKNLLYQVNNQEAQLKFKLSQARISDSQRRFFEAGSVYHDISTVPLLADDERDFTLSKGIICAILSPAGPPRTALLRKLHREERAQDLEEYGMLENMYLGRLISPAQSDAFAKKLDAHQVAKTSDGSTVLAKAVVEHNLLGISKIYESISITELGMLLGLDAAKAEEYAARMVQQNRLKATIDHCHRYIMFTDSPRNAGSNRLDSRIESLLEDVERVASLANI